MKQFAASIAASVCGFLGMWLLEWRERVEMWASRLGWEDEPIKAGGTISDEDGEG